MTTEEEGIARKELHFSLEGLVVAVAPPRLKSKGRKVHHYTIVIAGEKPLPPG